MESGQVSIHPFIHSPIPSIFTALERVNVLLLRPPHPRSGELWCNFIYAISFCALLLVTDFELVLSLISGLEVGCSILFTCHSFSLSTSFSKFPLVDRATNGLLNFLEIWRFYTLIFIEWLTSTD